MSPELRRWDVWLELHLIQCWELATSQPALEMKILPDHQAYNNNSSENVSKSTHSFSKTSRFYAADFKNWWTISIDKLAQSSWTMKVITTVLRKVEIGWKLLGEKHINFSLLILRKWTLATGKKQLQGIAFLNFWKSVIF